MKTQRQIPQLDLVLAFLVFLLCCVVSFVKEPHVANDVESFSATDLVNSILNSISGLL